MIPANIDHVAIVQDMNRWGIADQKVEIICGFSRGYIAKIKNGGVQQMLYQRAARLYNFWLDEHRARATSEPVQTLAPTS